MLTNRTYLHLILALLLLTSTLVSSLVVPTPSTLSAMPAHAVTNQPPLPDPPRPTAATPTATVQGRVTDAMGQAASLVRVRLMLPDGTIAQEVVTGRAGLFIFQPQQTDRYQLWVLTDNGRPLRWEGDQLFTVTGDDAQAINHEIRLREFVQPGNPVTASASLSITVVPSETPANRPQSQSPATGQLQGTVTAADTGQPIAFGQVRAYDSNGDFVSSRFTNNAGEYSFGSLQPDAYRISFAPAGSTAYLGEFYNDKPTLETADPITVTDGASVTGIDAVLARAAVISGTITTADTHLPMADVRVSLYALDETVVQVAFTGNSGRYQLDGVRPGQYKLAILPTSNGDWSDYLPEYFNHQADLAGADLITLSTAETRIIDAQLIRSGRILGTVTDAVNGTPLAAIKVSIYNSEAIVIDESTTTATGVYTITGLATGSYRLHFSPPASGVTDHYLSKYHNDKPTLALADPVAVTINNDVIVNAQLTPGGRIAGQVTDQTAGTPIADIIVEAYDRHGLLQASTATTADGAYLLNGLASGAYWLYFEAPDSGPSAMYGNTHHLESVAVTAPNVVNGVNLQLTKLGQISGKVTATDSGSGLPNVLVQIYDQDGLFVDSIHTAANGSYTTPGLFAGSYRLYALPPNGTVIPAYLATFYNGKTTLLQADSVAVSGPGLVTNTNITLARGGAVTGKVTAADTGQPLTNVSVYLFDETLQRVRNVPVSATGAYTMAGLPTGPYIVQFVPSSFGSSSDYAPIYYQGKGDIATADTVQVTAPNTTANINGILPLRTTVTGKITGKITADATELPLDSVRVRARDANDDIIADTNSDSNGIYTLDGLPTGRYRLQFTPSFANVGGYGYIEEYYNNKTSAESADSVAVTAPATVNNIDAALALSGQISGQIRAADTDKPLQAQVSVYDSTGVRVDTTTADDDTGRYTFTRLPAGNYRLYIAPTGLPYIPTFSGNASSLADATPVAVTSGQSSENVDMALSRGGQIVGQVLAAESGLPVGFVTLELRNGSTGQSLGTMRTDRDGRYSTFGLANGTYQVYVADDSPYLAIRSPTVAVTTAGSATTVNLQLSRGAALLGRVMADGTKQPIGGVRVALIDCGPNQRSDSTNWLGLYLLDGLATGSYDLVYETDDDNASSPYVSTTVTGVSVTAPAELVRHQTLVRGGQIGGVVTAADSGRALEDVYVYTYNDADQLLRFVSTNAVGAYALRGLPDGKYRVIVSPDDDGPSAAYTLEYYNDQTQFDQAQRLTISGANRLDNINPTLARGARISGRLLSAESGLPLEDIDVHARDQNGSYWGSTQTDSNGYFMTSGLRSGAYRLYFRSYYGDSNAGYAYQYYNKKTTLATGETINVTAPNLHNGYDATLALGGRIGGLVTDKHGLPLNDIYNPHLRRNRRAGQLYL